MKELLHVINLICVLLVASICRLFEIKRHLRYILSLAGVAVILLLCSVDSIYFAALLIGGCIIIKSKFMLANPRAVFLFAISFQVFFTASPYFGLRYSETNVADALIFVATMKIVIVANEIFDLRTSKTERNFAEKHPFGVLTLDKEPSILDICCYMTCIIGLITGPFCKYRTYDDMLRNTYKPISLALRRQILQAVGFLVAYLVTEVSVDTKYFGSFEYNLDPIYMRLLHIYPIGLAVVYKYAAVWSIAQISMVLVGLGMYPSECQSKIVQGPIIAAAQPRDQTDKPKQEYDFETIQNVDFVNGYFDSSVSRGILCWNRSVQWWLVQFVYRSDLVPRHMKFLRTLIVFFVSALWHGVDLSYFMVICSFAFVLPMDDYCIRFGRECIKVNWAKRVFLIVYWALVKMFVVSFIMASFPLLDYELVTNMFLQTYFAIFLFPLAFMIPCALVSFIFGVDHVKDADRKAA